MEGSQVGSDENLYRIGATKLRTGIIGCHVEILPDRGLDNAESFRDANGKADRSTIWKHRKNENNEE